MLRREKRFLSKNKERGFHISKGLLIERKSKKLVQKVYPVILYCGFNYQLIKVEHFQDS